MASTTSASSIGGRLREDPLLDLLIEQQEKPLRGVVSLEGGSASEVEQAARLFLETSRRCFQTSMDAMELDEAEMESDYRSQERDNVMSTWTEMLCELQDPRALANIKWLGESSSTATNTKLRSPTR